jgi:GxxExxY protein
MDINDLTHTIIGCAYKVHNVLGSGFLEKVYENALKIELDKLGINAMQQEELKVWYEGQSVGIFYPDLWIEKQLIVEVKAVQNLAKEHEVKLVHYLTATQIDSGLLINFGSSVQVKRKFREYKAKGSLLNGLLKQSTDSW